MSWATLIPLMVQYGIPATYQLWQIITTHPEPTEEAWQKLLALALKPMPEYLREAQARADAAKVAQLSAFAVPAPAT